MELICRDLADEYQSLDNILSELKEEEWQTVTPFFDWTIQDQLSHLAYFDSVALMAATDRAVFRASAEEFFNSLEPGDDLFRIINREGAKIPARELLSLWRKHRQDLIDKLRTIDPEAKLPWFGPDMNCKTFATARLMEVWAHGQDAVDTLGIRRVPTDRLRHIAHLGVVTMGWSFVCREMKAPRDKARVELESPSGDLWVWGPENAENRVAGSAEEFCLLVTQRRNVADTKLKYQGETASQWMKIAQAFAGEPADHPAPGERAINY